MKLIKSLVVLSVVGVAASAWASQWNYSGFKGPKHWGGLSSGYALCANGQQQSPIDLEKAKAIPLKDDHLSLHYHNASFYLRESPHNLYQDSVKPTKNYLAYNGDRYNLVEIHFHVPSEHHLNGHQYPMEAHLVHRNSSNELLVLAVFMEEGSANNYLAALMNASQFQAIGEEVETSVELNPVNLNPNELFSRSKEYYSYQGSLTTPPCVEGVTWIVAQAPVQLSAQQLKAFKSQITSFNARPLQDLNGRELGIEGGI